MSYWTYAFDHDVALHMFQSLSLGTLSTQLEVVNSCDICNPVIATKGNIDLYRVRDAKNRCQFCALILRTFKPDYEDQVNTPIIRKQYGRQSLLQIGIEGPRLWISPDEGQCH
jgi:hypothetical protein